MRADAERLQLTLDFLERARELLPAGGMRRRFELPAQLREGKPERFRPPQPLGIAIALRHGPARPLFFTLVHPFLNSILRVDQSFA